MPSSFIRSRRALVAGVGALGLIASTAAGAAASSQQSAVAGSAALTAAHHRMPFTPEGHIGTPMRAPSGISALTRGHGYNINGGNWSGMAAQGSGFTSTSASWVEPSVTCNSSNDLMAPWVGIDGYGSSSVEQTGVATDCSSGRPVYQAWYEMYPAGPVYYSNRVQAGDKITASVTRSGSSYTLKLTDVTQGWSKTTNKSLDAANASAEFIIESPTGAYPQFGSVNFTNAEINGNALGDYGPVAMDASNSYGYEDHTSGLSGGTDFSISYLHE